jgi:glycosyltransferase involved in cell wall biosynthesis
MFLRRDRRRPGRKVLVHGLVYFGQVFADFMSGEGWDFQYFPDQGIGNLASMTNALRDCDLVYQIGGRVTVGRFLRTAKLFGREHIVMHWVGSDAVEQKPDALLGKLHPWILNGIHHWADSEWIQKEVGMLGISSALVPLPSPRIPDCPSPLPENFCVMVYVPSVERSELYGLDMILEAARQLPEIQFELVGLRDGPVADPPANIIFHNRIRDLREFYARASVVWRPARHDGLSWMVLESLGHGRHVLWTYPFPGCHRADSAAEAIVHILRLHELHKGKNLRVNQEGVDYIAASEYRPQTFRDRIRADLAQIIDT